MTSSIPDSLSSDDLQRYAEAAKKQAEKDQSDQLFDGKTQDELMQIAEAACDQASDQCCDPMVHKVMVITIINQMIQWHTGTGRLAFEDNESDIGQGWLRDAGKFQAIANILMTINVGPHDFITPLDD